jgi:uncharacterized membrane protein
MTPAFWFPVLMVTVHAVIFHVMPRLSRPDILFSVTVSEAFAAGAGRALVSRYRAIVWSSAAAWLAIGLLLPALVPGAGRNGFLMMGVVCGNALVAANAWYWAHRQARGHAVAPSAVRVASLVPRDTSLPGGALVGLGPFAVLLATALLVYVNGGGTIRPLRLLALGAVFVAMMLTLAVTMARRSRQVAVDGPAAAAEQRFRRVNIFGPVLAAYAAAIMLSAGTIESIPALGNAVTGKAWLLVMPMMLFNVGVMVWMFRVGQGGHRAVAPGARQDVHGDATPDHAWKIGGMYYVNPSDPAMWVENRIGLGYTLNLGNWRAWLLIIGMMLVPMVASRLLF